MLNPKTLTCQVGKKQEKPYRIIPLQNRSKTVPTLRPSPTFSHVGRKCKQRLPALLFPDTQSTLISMLACSASILKLQARCYPENANTACSQSQDFFQTLSQHSIDPILQHSITSLLQDCMAPCTSSSLKQFRHKMSIIGQPLALPSRQSAPQYQRNPSLQNY